MFLLYQLSHSKVTVAIDQKISKRANKSTTAFSFNHKSTTAQIDTVKSFQIKKKLIFFRSQTLGNFYLKPFKM